MLFFANTRAPPASPLDISQSTKMSRRFTTRFARDFANYRRQTQEKLAFVRARSIYPRFAQLISYISHHG